MKHLLKNINLFYKMAGLLKNQESLVKEIGDWVIARYCGALGSFFYKKIEKNKARQLELVNIQASIEKWNDISDLINVIASYPYKPEKLNSLLKNLIGKLGDHGKLIPLFYIDDDKNGIDPVTNCYGVIDKSAGSWLQLVEQNPGIYLIRLNIDFEANDDGIKINKKYERGGLTAKSIHTILKNISKDFDKILNYYEKFAQNYEIITDNQLKELIMIAGYCKRAASNQEGSFNKTQIFNYDIDPRYNSEKKEMPVILVRCIDGPTAHKDGDAFWYDLGYKKIYSKHRNQFLLGRIDIIQNVTLNSKDIRTLDNLHDTINELKINVEHELLHTIQNFIKSDTTTGLPSEDVNESDFYTPEGLPKRFPMSPEMMEPDDEYKRIVHPLRNVEFYTKLNDSVFYFNKKKINFPLALHKDFMLFWINHIDKKTFEERIRDFCKKEIYNKFNLNYDADETQNNNINWSKINKLIDNLYNSIEYKIEEDLFFKWLKIFQPKKYVKACAEFSRAVDLWVHVDELNGGRKPS